MTVKTITFTNLHISNEGWWITSREIDGRMADFDLASIDPNIRTAIVNNLIAAVQDPKAIRRDYPAGGIQ